MRSRTHRDRGATIAITALLLPVLVVATAIAVDLGRQMGERRDLQAAADAIALDLSRLADGRTLQEITTDDLDGNGEADYLTVRKRSAGDNDVELAELTDELGIWRCADGTRPDDDASNPCPDATFTPVTDPNAFPDAVRVTIRREVDYVFQPGGGSTSRTAIAHQPEWAYMSIGSRFAEAQPCVFADSEDGDPCNLDSEDVHELNRVLTVLNGASDVNLTALGYSGLLTANVTIGDLAVAAGVGSADELADLEITPTNAATIAATALSNEGDLVRAELYNQLVDIAQTRDAKFFQPTPEIPDPPVQVPVVPDDFWDFSNSSSEAVANGRVNLFDFFVSTLEVSNGKNLLTTCSGTTDNTEIEAAHDGVDDPAGGANAVVPPTDLGPVAVISDQLCLDVVQTKAYGMGPLFSGQLSRDNLRTSQLEASHTTLIRFGDPNTSVPLQSGEPCDLIPDNGVADCELLDSPTDPGCDAIADNGVADCTAAEGDPCDRVPDTSTPADDAIPECPTPPPAPCNDIAGDGIEDCVASVGTDCEALDVPDNGEPVCSAVPQDPLPCNNIAGDSISDCTAAAGDPCDHIPDGGTIPDDGNNECPSSVPPPCNNLPSDGIRDCIAAPGNPCDEAPDGTFPDDGEFECPLIPDIPCDDEPLNGVPDCVRTTAEGEVPSLPEFNLNGVAIPISGDLELPVTVTVAGGSAEATKIECDALTDDHRVDTNIYSEPVTLRIGNGSDTPIGTIQITDPVTGTTYGANVFVDAEVVSTAPLDSATIPVGESHQARGANPFEGFELADQHIRVEPVGLPTLPDGSLLDPLTSLIDETTGTVTSITTRTTEAIVGLVADTILDELIKQGVDMVQTEVESTTESTTAKVTRVHNYVNETSEDLVVGSLLGVLDTAGFGLATVEVTNIGIGNVVTDENGDIMTDANGDPLFDVICGLPTLVD